MDLTLNEALIGLFTSAFVSATLFPGGSEAVLLAVIHHWPEELALALSVASVGNTLGSMTSYFIGRLFPKKVSSRAIEWFERWGVWALLFAWLPVAGGCAPCSRRLASYRLAQKFDFYFCWQGVALWRLSAWFFSTFLTKFQSQNNCLCDMILRIGAAF